LSNHLKYSTVSSLAFFIAAALAGVAPVRAAETAGEVPAGTHPTAARVAASAEMLAEGLLPSRPISDADLWQRIRRGFALEELNTPLVQNHEQWYASRPEYIQRFVDRGSRYLYHVVEEVERRGMPTEVALLPIIESAFNPQAYSRAKAAGMWQFIPSTGKHFGLKQDASADNRRDVLLSTHAALDYLQKLYGMFNSWELAFAAYNCGEGCVGRAIQKNLKKGLPTDILSLNLPPETRNYVPKLIAVKNIILAPGSYGIELDSVHNRPYFAKVSAPPKIDVKLAARLAEMGEEEFAALNPASTKPVASTSTGYFLVPAEKADTFRENLELYRSLNGPLVSWKVMTAGRGESVDTVARRYGMTASYLRAVSGPIKEKKGKLTHSISLMVPMPKEAKHITDTLERKVALKASQPPKTAQPVTNAEAVDAVLPGAATAVAAATVPVVAAVAPAASQRTNNAANNAPNDSVPGDPAGASYRVQQGDTLYSIARRFNVSLDQLKKQNALNRDIVAIGQVLTLPAAGAAVEDTAGLVRVSNPPQKVSPRINTYVVRAGDTLFGIASKLGVNLNELMRWNRLTARSVLQPGHKLRVSA
jgi:membrane-bound lytic murein transglycosylase D